MSAIGELSNGMMRKAERQWDKLCRVLRDREDIIYGYNKEYIYEYVEGNIVYTKQGQAPITYTKDMFVELYCDSPIKACDKFRPVCDLIGFVG